LPSPLGKLTTMLLLAESLFHLSNSTAKISGGFRPPPTLPQP
jgi:hypothetical protein